MIAEGKITGRVLVLDFDDVILHSERLIDEAIAKFWYTASDRYARELNRQFANNTIKTRDELDAQLEIYYDKKNQMLEEVYPHLKGKIDYKKIINEKNISPETIKQVNELIASSRYDMVIIESHYNSQEEKDCKDQLIKKIFPGAFFLPVRFFEQDYIKSKESDVERIRTSKAEYLMDYLDLNGIEYDFSLFTLIDNSPSNIRDWIKNGGIGLVYGNSSNLPSIENLALPTVVNIENQLTKVDRYNNIKRR